MDIKLQISEDLDYIFSIRLGSYIKNSLIEKYFLYIDRYSLLELKLKEIVNQVLEGSLYSTKSKTFKQLVNVLKDRKEYSELFKKLKISMNYRNKIHEMFWVEKSISKSMGRTINTIDEKYLDEAIYELEHVLIFCEWLFIKQNLL